MCQLVYIILAIIRECGCRFITALCRGINALYPCPRCHVPKAEQHNLGNLWPLRTQAKSKEIYDEACALSDKGDTKGAEDKLKNTGLYQVEVSCLYFTAHAHIPCY
jgi:hypothetical protein